MRATVFASLFVVLCASVCAANQTAQVASAAFAVYHEGVVTFTVEHPEAVSSSVRVFDLETGSPVFDSGPRPQTSVVWPAGFNVTGSFRYVITAWNETGEVVVSQVGTNNRRPAIADISFDTIPGNTSLIADDEINLNATVAVGTTPGVRLLPESSTHGGAVYLFEEDGTTTHTIIEPDYSGEGGYFYMSGQGPDFVNIQSMGEGNDPELTLYGSNIFSVYTGLSGNESVVMPGNAVSSQEIFDEPGVASTYETPQMSLSGTPANVLTHTIVAPTSGYILATSFVDVEMHHNTGTTSSTWCSLSDVSGSHFPPGAVQAQISTNAPGGGYKIPISLTRVIPTSAGAKQIHLVCSEGHSPNGNYVNDRYLALLFVPTAYGGIL